MPRDLREAKELEESISCTIVHNDKGKEEFEAIFVKIQVHSEGWSYSRDWMDRCLPGFYLRPDLVK